MGVCSCLPLHNIENAEPTDGVGRCSDASIDSNAPCPCQEPVYCANHSMSWLHRLLSVGQLTGTGGASRVVRSPS